MRVVRMVEETDRSVSLGDVGNSFASEHMAREACTTLPTLGELDTRSSRERSYSLRCWNRAAGLYPSGDVLLPGFDSHGLVRGRGRQHRVHSSHTGQRDTLAVGRREAEVVVVEGKRIPGSSWLPSARSQHTNRGFTPWREGREKDLHARRLPTFFDRCGHVPCGIRSLIRDTSFYFTTRRDT